MKDALTEPADHEADDVGTIRRSVDPELRIMGHLVRALDAVDGPTRTRIVLWLLNRYAAMSVVKTTALDPRD